MKINRSLIKEQAKALIKGSVFSLFLISVVVGICTGGLSIGSRLTFDLDDFKDAFNKGSNSYSQNFFGNDFAGEEFFDDDFDAFFEQSFPQQKQNSAITTVMAFLTGIFGTIMAVAQIFLAPLTITLLGIYVMLVHGNKMKVEDNFKYTFSKTFDSNYWKKLILYFVENIIIGLMTALFIIPGIIFYYRYYFANMIMADNPNLSAKQAVKLSIKMTDGHKGELFALDLSFLGWVLLTPLTLGLVTIYTMPYYMTTKTLYYENFKGRALAEGILTQEDFENNTFDMPTYSQNVNQGQYYTPTAPAQAPTQQPVVNVEPQPAPVAQPVAPAVEEPVEAVYAEPVVIPPVAVQPPEQTSTPANITVEEPAIEDTDDFGTHNSTNYYNGMF